MLSVLHITGKTKTGSGTEVAQIRFIRLLFAYKRGNDNVEDTHCQKRH